MANGNVGLTIGCGVVSGAMGAMSEVDEWYDPLLVFTRGNSNYNIASVCDSIASLKRTV